MKSCLEGKVHNWKREGKIFYCSICFYHPGKAEREQLNKNFQLTEAKKKREYFRNYMRRLREKYPGGLKLSQAAQIKKVTPQTMKNNLQLFKLVSKHPNRIAVDINFLEWKPRRKYL